MESPGELTREMLAELGGWNLERICFRWLSLDGFNKERASDRWALQKLPIWRRRGSEYTYSVYSAQSASITIFANNGPEH